MTILIIPTEKCNFRCIYCFEEEDVRRPESPLEMDIQAIERSLNILEQSGYAGSDIGIHGGECTTLPPRDLEPLLKMIYDRTGSTSITTNGYNINDSFIRLFKKYKTYVGISIDGPEELNLLRGPNPHDEKVTRGYNRKMKKIIRKLRKEGIPVSIMCILHKENAGTQEKLDILKEWLLWLADLGITGGRLNPMYSVPWNKQYELTNEELTRAWTQLFDFVIDNGLRWNPFREMIDNLLGFSLSPCINGQCDFFKTSTVSILPDGTISNCDRTFQNGLHMRSETNMASGRYQALCQTQCAGCKYWPICNAGCPCEGIDGDWRNKTRFCDATYALYEHIERRIKNLFPNVQLITESNEREPFKLMSYRYSDRPSAYGAAPLKQGVQIQPPQGQIVAGHGDSPHGDGHGDRPHGDRPHGDSG